MPETNKKLFGNQSKLLMFQVWNGWSDFNFYCF